MMEHRLTQRINEANTQGRTALIPFLTAGFPTKERFWPELLHLDQAGADIIEIGVPFSDPVADGPVVEEASQRALEQGMTLDWILDGLLERSGQFKAGLVLMGYYNPFLQYGLEAFAEKAARVGVEGCVVPDLPLGEDGAMREVLTQHGLALVPLVGVNTGPERMLAYAKQKSSGYAYMVSVLGTTGVRVTLAPELEQAFRLAVDTFSVPVAIGFGLSSPEQVEALPIQPKAVVFGSALLRHIDQGNSAESFMRRWTGK